MSFISDLLGTSNSFFRIGLSGPRLKAIAGGLALRNKADSADVELQTSTLRNTGDRIEINSDAAGTGSDRKLGLNRNSVQAADLEIFLPGGKATDGWMLRQKAGTATGVLELEFAAPLSGSQTVDTTSLAFGTTSPLALFTNLAGSVITKIQVCIDTAFNGTPSLSIGISGSTSKYVASTQVDLTEAAGTVFEITPGLAAAGSDENLIATYSAGSASAGAARILVYYSTPV